MYLDNCAIESALLLCQLAKVRSAPGSLWVRGSEGSTKVRHTQT